MKRVAILGIGPSALMAAYAASFFGAFVSIFTRGDEGSPTKSKIGGAQFLHLPLPGINHDVPDAEIRYLTSGSTDGYREKVYGEEPVDFVSMSHVVDRTVVPAWSLSATYDLLWEQMVVPERVNIATITPVWLHELIESGNFDLIVSTVPRMAVCLAHAGLVDGRPHAFVSQPVRIMNRSTIEELPDNTMVYDGTRNVSWYRTSKIFGTGATEWSESAPDRLPYEEEIVKIRKPLRTDCSCFSDHVLFTGRFGEWRKGVLTHHSFQNVYKELER